MKLETVVPINMAARSIIALVSALVRKLIRADSLETMTVIAASPKTDAYSVRHFYVHNTNSTPHNLSDQHVIGRNRDQSTPLIRSSFPQVTRFMTGLLQDPWSNPSLSAYGQNVAEVARFGFDGSDGEKPSPVVT
jgi:hypothetical protein